MHPLVSQYSTLEKHLPNGWSLMVAVLNICQNTNEDDLQCQSVCQAFCKIGKHYQNTLKCTVCQANHTGTNGCFSGADARKFLTLPSFSDLPLNRHLRWESVQRLRRVEEHLIQLWSACSMLSGVGGRVDMLRGLRCQSWRTTVQKSKGLLNRAHFLFRHWQGKSYTRRGKNDL